MRFTFAESMCDPMQLPRLAVAAEEAGYHGFTIPESVCYPRDANSRYPYTPDGAREFLEGRPFIEPFVLAAALGAVTKRIRFATFVVKLPLRNPVLAAKQATSVAVLCGGRFSLGVGLSPWREDFAAVQVPWAQRGARLDEAIEVLRGLETGDYFEFHGAHFDFPALKLCPVPQRPIPILIGGHSAAALRRAARCGDGWMHAGSGGDGLDTGAAIRRINQMRAEYGRANSPFEFHVISPDAYTPEGVKRLEEQGVTDAIVAFRNAYEADVMPLQAKLDALRKFADEVIAKAG